MIRSPGSDDGFIDSMLVRQVREEHPNYTMIHVEGATSLSPAQRRAIIIRLRREGHARDDSSFDGGQPLRAELLAAALRDITPDVDEEAEQAAVQQEQDEARQELERDGCPPCDKFTPNASVILSYWEHVAGLPDVAWSSQLADWRRFRAFQDRIRTHSTAYGKWTAYRERILARARGAGLDKEANFGVSEDKHQQTKLTTWCEYEEYHARIHEAHIQRLEAACDPEVGPDSGIGAISHGTAMGGRRRHDDIVERIRQHKILLHWIEQQRAMIGTTSRHGVKNAFLKGKSRLLDNEPSVIRMKKLAHVPPRRWTRQQSRALAVDTTSPVTAQRRSWEAGSRPIDRAARRRPQQASSVARRDAKRLDQQLSSNNESSKRQSESRSGAGLQSDAHKSANRMPSVTTSCTVPPVYQITRSGRVSKRPARYGWDQGY